MMMRGCGACHFSFLCNGIDVSDDVMSPNPSVPSSGRQAPSLLVVDDDADIRQIIGLVLESAGYRVVSAVDGRDALRVFNSQPFELIITDMLMPGSDGLELLSAVKKSGTTTKVLMMSGGGMIGVNDYLKVAKKLGAHAVLEKPFTAETLLSAVAELLKA